MGLRCTLLGHAYGEPVTERDREQRGDEVVVTIRQVKTCSRCGTEQVVSENTEVTHVEATDAEPAEDTTATGDDGESVTREADVSELVESAESGASEPAGASGFAGRAPDTTESEDAVIMDETESEPTAPSADAEPDQATQPMADFEPAGTDRTDDPEAEIIDSGPEDSEPTETEPAEPTPGEADTDPEQTEILGAEGDSEPADATADTAEPETMFGTTEESESQAEAADTAGGDWPETDATADSWSASPPGDSDEATDRGEDPGYQFQSQPETDTTDEPDRGPTGITSKEPLDVEAEPDTPDQSLECPECGFSEGPGTSLRAGDICPECHRGYLARQ